jgi:hypothetical protein
MKFDDYLFTRHLDDDEEVAVIVHKHWFIGVLTLWLPATIFIISFAILASLKGSIMFLVTLLIMVASFIWLLRNFFDYFLDAWIITNQGIIDVEWHGWFHRQSSRVLYSDIQGVSYEIEGVLQTMLHIGTMSIEKISAGVVVALEHVKHPRKIESVILKNMEEYLTKKNLKDATHVQDILGRIVAQEIQLQDIKKSS